MKTVCGCCEPVAKATPLVVENRPALSAVAYRVGTYASFRQAMLQALSEHPELRGLTTRDSDDYGITFLELWAAVADFLNFYQERYANEAFLRTARFRDSVERLAALIDYRPRPGVAARAWLTFTLDDGKRLEVPAGQQVQSVPEQDELPQVFETLEAVTADARLNRLRVLPAPIPLPVLLPQGATESILDRIDGPAIAAGLAPGDRVLLFKAGTGKAPEEKRIGALETRDDAVVLVWDQPIQSIGWSAPNTQAFKFRRVLRLFGHNAPPSFMQPDDSSGRIVWSMESTEFDLPAGDTLWLDGQVDGLHPGAKLLVANAPSQKTLVTIQSVQTAAKTIGPLSSAVTRLDVIPNIPQMIDLRRVLVYELEGDPITFWDADYPQALTGEEVYLPGVAVDDDELDTGVEVGRPIVRDAFEPGVVLFPSDIEKGRTVLLDDDSGDPVRAVVQEIPEIVPPSAAPGSFCHLKLTLDVDGALAHDAASAVLLGNVAHASHGETVNGEILGSGDAAAVFPRLALSKAPLTHLPAGGSEGAAPSLDVRVDGILWRRVAGLFGQPPDAEVYELRHDDGATIVQFGDDETGAVPPSGRNNLTATYRVGAGLAGRVGAGALTTLLAKPTGLAEATNPLAAEGGADPESLEAARHNAPRTVRTFGRAVSLLDFEDLVTASGEVAKARATWVWDGLERAIHLTIAGQDGGTFSEQARRDLGDNLRTVRDPNHRLRIDNFTTVFVELHAGIAVDPAHEREVVAAAARQAVIDALDFDTMALGQAVHLSDLYRVLQEVPGVVFVDIDRLQFKRPSGMPGTVFLLYLLRRGATKMPVQHRLRIFPARPDPKQPGVVLPAELAALESPDEDLEITVRES